MQAAGWLPGSSAAGHHRSLLELNSFCRLMFPFWQVAEFNKANRWKKRGVAMLPVKYGIAFSALHLNQVRQVSSRCCPSCPKCS